MKRSALLCVLALLLGATAGLLLNFSQLDGRGLLASNAAAATTPSTALLSPYTTVSSVDPDSNAPLLDAGNAVLAALKKDDIQTLSTLVDPERGVTFTPYSTVNFDSDLTFTPAQVQALSKDKNLYTWGFEDGRGNPIKMTMEQYFARYVYNTDYTQATVIGVDQIITTGNALENLTEEYPGCRFVDFCLPSADPQNDGLDWSSLKLVFTLEDSGWMLVGIVHGEWTV